MIRAYVEAAMHKAHYEIVEPCQRYYGEIEPLEGVVGTGTTIEECREDLEDALDAWIVLGLQLGHAIPEIDGISLNRLEASA